MTQEENWTNIQPYDPNEKVSQCYQTRKDTAASNSRRMAGLPAGPKAVLGVLPEGKNGKEGDGMRPRTGRGSPAETGL